MDGIRWMLKLDLPQVVAIEAGSFSIPWTESDFLTCLARRDCVCMVACHGEEVIGYIAYSLRESNGIQILNLAVKDAYRRKGIASKIVAKVMHKLSPNRRKFIKICIRERNLAAQLFFRTIGFKACSVLHNYYTVSDEDAYLMVYRHQSEVLT